MQGRINSSVIRQKGESQNGCFKKAKHAKISEKHRLFYGNFGVLCFLETPVLRFALLLYSRRTNSSFLIEITVVPSGSSFANEET